MKHIFIAVAVLFAVSAAQAQYTETKALLSIVLDNQARDIAQRYLFPGQYEVRHDSTMAYVSGWREGAGLVFRMSRQLPPATDIVKQTILDAGIANTHDLLSYNGEVTVGLRVYVLMRQDRQVYNNEGYEPMTLEQATTLVANGNAAVNQAYAKLAYHAYLVGKALVEERLKNTSQNASFEQ